jgi:hypothetical protein
MQTCDYCGRQENDATTKCGVCGNPLPDSEILRENEAGAGYEFSPDQERTIASVGSSMRLVGIVLLFAGVLQIGAALIAVASGNAVSFAVQGIIAFILGTFTLQAGTSFQDIVTTKGRNIDYLMEALIALRKLYRVQVCLLIISLVVVALSVAVLFASK